MPATAKKPPRRSKKAKAVLDKVEAEGITSHPLRRRILGALQVRNASPAELSALLGESLGNVSYHVKILASKDAIELVRTAPVRGALEHFYAPTGRVCDECEGRGFKLAQSAADRFTEDEVLEALQLAEVDDEAVEAVLARLRVVPEIRRFSGAVDA